MEVETGECDTMAAAAAAAAAGEMYLLTARGGGGCGSVATAASAAASRAMGRKGRKVRNREKVKVMEREIGGRVYMEREFMGRVAKRGLRVKVEKREREEGLMRLEAQLAENVKFMEGTVPGSKLSELTTSRSRSSEDEQGVPDFDAGFDSLDLSRWT